MLKEGDNANDIDYAVHGAYKIMTKADNLGNRL